MRLIDPLPGIRAEGTLRRRVGFDAHCIGQRQTGNETYASGLLSGLSAIGVTLDVFTSPGAVAPPHRSHEVQANPVLRQIGISSRCRRFGFDLYHASYILPPWLGCPAIVTVHDISFAHHPEWLPRGMAARLALLAPLAMRRARRVITVSHAVKVEISERYGIPPEKIAVTHLAPRERGRSGEAATKDEPYFLFVGNAAPRKNLGMLFRALALLHQRGLAIPLVVAGATGTGGFAKRRDLRAQAGDLGIEQLVRFEGYVSDERVRALYAGCTALVHPAWHEGFGLTPLEAMAAGAPVLASDIPAIREVTDGAAMLIDPAAPDAWADGMERTLSDDHLARRMTFAGIERARQFSWERCARETLAVYDSALAG